MMILPNHPFTILGSTATPEEDAAILRQVFVQTFETVLIHRENSSCNYQAYISAATPSSCMRSVTRLGHLRSGTSLSINTLRIRCFGRLPSIASRYKGTSHQRLKIFALMKSGRVRLRMFMPSTALKRPTGPVGKPHGFSIYSLELSLPDIVSTLTS